MVYFEDIHKIWLYINSSWLCVNFIENLLQKKEEEGDKDV